MGRPRSDLGAARKLSLSRAKCLPDQRSSPEHRIARISALFLIPSSIEQSMGHIPVDSSFTLKISNSAFGPAWTSWLSSSTRGSICLSRVRAASAMMARLDFLLEKFETEGSLTVVALDRRDAHSRPRHMDNLIFVVSSVYTKDSRCSSRSRERVRRILVAGPLSILMVAALAMPRNL